MATSEGIGAAGVARFEGHLAATAGWIEQSIAKGKGGSCAYYSPAGGWSRPYPETTGYLIPTLLALAQALPGFRGEERAHELGAWLLSIQDADGWWHGGVHGGKKEGAPSVFNTAQILQGLVALHDHSDDERWLSAALAGAGWLADEIDASGLWPGGDYRSDVTPSYYAYAAWPMLEVAVRGDSPQIRAAAEGALAAILERRRPNGTFAGWGFVEGKPAFTHTIAYTLQGLIGAAKLLGDWDRYGEPTEAAMLALARLAEAADGRLPGRIDDEWSPAARYVCLTGNAQIALCLLDWNEREPAPERNRIAAGLVEAVCAAQRLRAPVGGVRGAVGGSSPIWGGYMVLRYPNWAAKYHCDALMRLLGTLAGRG